ncbi:LacI family DNA-binding transcriptional regulator [Arthrobacter sp. NPDC090010]|uniref:LacI family DNA-binding transcriptional regulator n=1 Tax=Arthrobacter sp. NPDC090010 TaxID=3363942 RepID=UPI0037F5B830
MQPPQAKPTIYNVAARAGVSISTVSLAINHPQRVSAATRKRVAEAAEAEGYRSAGAGPRRGLRSVAALAPFSTWPSYYQRLDGILDRCTAAGVEVVVHNLPPNEQSEVPLLDAIPVRGDLDGVIVMGRQLTAAAEAAIERSGIPTVLVDAESDRLPTVLTDDVHGGILIAEHLVELGHRRIVFAYEGPAWFDHSSSGLHRLAGIEKVVKAGQGTVSPLLFDERFLDAFRGFGATAIVANHDSLAARISRLLADSGLSVPGEVSVAGFDGGELATTLGLTSVRQPFAATGAAAAELLLGMLTGTAPQIRTTTLASILVPGDTTGTPSA